MAFLATLSNSTKADNLSLVISMTASIGSDKKFDAHLAKAAGFKGPFKMLKS